MATGIMFQFTTPIVLAHPNLFVPRMFKDNRGVESGKLRYDFRGVMDVNHPDVPALCQKMIDAARAKWPTAKFANPLHYPRPRAGSVLDPATGQPDPLFMPMEWCLRSGTEIADKGVREKKDREAFRGKLVLISRGDYPPGLTYPNPNDGRGVDAPMSGPERMAVEQYFYGGVHCLVQVELRGYQVGNNEPGVSAYPSIVYSLNKGERIATFSGGQAKSGAAAFAHHTGHVVHGDPTAGMAVHGLV